MQTKLGNEGKLSHRQLVRLGGLIALVCGRTPYDHILEDLLENECVSLIGGSMEMTDKGRSELTRLTAMAGLRPEHYAEK